LCFPASSFTSESRIMILLPQGMNPITLTKEFAAFECQDTISFWYVCITFEIRPTSGEGREGTVFQRIELTFPSHCYQE
jgi:hypothetical protein